MILVLVMRMMVCTMEVLPVPDNPISDPLNDAKCKQDVQGVIDPSLNVLPAALLLKINIRLKP